MTDDIEAAARGDVSATELTATGGKLFKVGYFETPVVDRLSEGETPHYVLRNYVEGLEVDGTAHEAADNRRTVACLTERRVLFVVGGGGDADGEDRVFSLPFEEIIRAERDGQTFVVHALRSDSTVGEYRLEVKNDDQLGAAVEYLSERAGSSALEARVERIDSLVADAEDALEEDRYEAAIETLEEAKGVYDTYASIAKQVDSPPIPERSGESIGELISETRRQYRTEQYDERVREGDDLRERGEEESDPEAAAEAFEGAIESYEAALDIATEHGVGDPDAVRERIRTLRSKTGDRRLSALGRRVAGIEIPDPDEGAGEADLTETVSELESLLSTIDEVDIDRPEDVALVREEAVGKFVSARLRLAELRGADATETFRSGAYADAREAFSEVEERLRWLHSKVEDVDAEIPADRIDRLADACAENADVARRASLGLDDGGGLVPLDPDAETEDDSTDGESSERERPPTPPAASPAEPTSGRDAAGVEFAYDDFEKEELIGSGGNADVYRAVATVDGEEWTIALKEPRVQGTLHTEAIERFVSEAETWDKLDDHANIVSVVDYGSAPMPWIALEYMESGGLGSIAPELDFGGKLRVAVRITDAVWHAHQRGIAHLDLKPANILFTRDPDGRPLPKVADWGLAKMLLEHSQSVEGLSPQYSAPEQFDRGTYGPADNQTDVYQLGVIFYELFTGEHPFEGPAPEVMHSILHEAPDPPSDRDPSADVLDEILLTAMATDKSDRYEAVVYLRDALQDLR